MLHTHLSSGAGAIGQLVADIPIQLGLTPPHPTEQSKLWTERSGFDFSLKSVLTGSGAHPTSYAVGTRDVPWDGRGGGLKRPGREVEHFI
jgi:hypothetical protein